MRPEPTANRMATWRERTERDLERQRMEMAIQEARKCTSEPGTIAPKVGAVFVKDGRILGSAFRGESPGTVRAGVSPVFRL